MRIGRINFRNGTGLCIDIAIATEEGGNFLEFAVDLERTLPSVWVDVVPIQPNTPFIEYIERKGRVLYAV